MSKLEDLKPEAALRGILPETLVTVVSVRWHGSDAITLTHRSPTGQLGEQVLYRDDESRIEVVEQGRPWSFDGDGKLLRLVSEANRIKLAHLFDPVLAVHTSEVEPFPHQITAVYESMIERQAPKVLACGRSGCRQDDHGGTLNQRANRPRRPAKVSRCLSRELGRTVAG